MNYPDATDVEVKDGVLTFRARREKTSPVANKFTTNIPFLVIE